MRFRGGLLALALSVAPLAAEAQPFQGLYIGAGAGYNLPQNINLDGSGVINSGSSLNLNGGIVGLGSVGYALGNGFRFEIRGQLSPVRREGAFWKHGSGISAAPTRSVRAAICILTA